MKKISTIRKNNTESNKISRYFCIKKGNKKKEKQQNNTKNTAIHLFNVISYQQDLVDAIKDMYSFELNLKYQVFARYGIYNETLKEKKIKKIEKMENFIYYMEKKIPIIFNETNYQNKKKFLKFFKKNISKLGIGRKKISTEMKKSLNTKLNEIEDIASLKFYIKKDANIVKSFDAENKSEIFFSKRLSSWLNQSIN